MRVNDSILLFLSFALQRRHKASSLILEILISDGNTKCENFFTMRTCLILTFLVTLQYIYISSLQNINDYSFSPNKGVWGKQYIRCMNEIHNGYLRNASHLYENDMFFPYALKVIDGKKYVFTITPTSTDKRQYSFRCNENLAGTIYEIQYVTIFECYNTTTTTVDELNFSVHSTENSNVSYSFNLDVLLNCWHHEKKFLEELKSSKNIESAAIAVYKGRSKRALEWAVYHNLIGFDHIFLYVNQPWANEEDFKENFITWIPFSTNIGRVGGMSWDVFRIAGMTDIFWKARYLQIKWLLNADIDEYVWYNTSFDINKKPIQTYLDQFNNNFTKQGIHLNSIPYGSNASIRYEAKQTPSQFYNKSIFNFVHREKGNISNLRWQRMKMIAYIKSKKLHGLSTHGCHKGYKRECQVLRPKPDSLRINHYKNPEYGVFNTFQNVRNLNELTKDTDLRDRYSSKIEEIVFSK